MLGYRLWPKAAPLAHRAPRWLVTLMAVMSCNHSSPFQSDSQDPTVPLDDRLPRQVTYSPDPDQTPSRAGSGNDWLYSYVERTGTGVLNFCIGGLPAEGGGRTRTYCDVTLGRLGLRSAVTWPAESPAGRLAYFRTRGAPNSAEFSAGLILGSFAPRDSGTVLRSFPYPATAGTVRGITHLAWLDSHTLLFVAAQIQYTGTPFNTIDTLTSGLQIERLDVDHLPAGPDVIPGTALSTSLEPMADGGGFYFTVVGNSRVFRHRMGSGATDTVYDFGAQGIARDVRYADSVLYAIVGGAVTVVVNDTVGTLQDDRGGTLTRVDLRTGAVSSLPIPGPARHAALSGDHRRLMVEDRADDRDLWIVGAP